MRLGIYGLGSVGRLVALSAMERGHEISGAVDVDPAIVGRDLGEALGLGERLGVRISREASALEGSELVIHATGSHLDRVYPQIAEVLGMGRSVVSTCETLSYPYYRYPVLARRLDELARSRGALVLGTGVNPGFLLDALVIALSAPLNRVERVRAVRVVDASRRREPFRRKIGVGEDPRAVEEKLRRGELTGHVGFAESVLLVADASGIQLSRVEEAQRPVAAESDIESRGIRVPRGMCKGISGYGAGHLGGSEVIRVELHAHVGAEEGEEISVEGRGEKIVWRSTGTPGDAGTASVVLSVAEKILGRYMGLITMADLMPFRPNIAGVHGARG